QSATGWRSSGRFSVSHGALLPTSALGNLLIQPCAWSYWGFRIPQGARERLSFFDEVDEPAPPPRTTQRRRRPSGGGRRPPSDQQAILIRRAVAAAAILIVIILIVIGVHSCQI